MYFLNVFQGQKRVYPRIRRAPDICLEPPEDWIGLTDGQSDIRRVWRRIDQRKNIRNRIRKYDGYNCTAEKLVLFQCDLLYAFCNPKICQLPFRTVTLPTQLGTRTKKPGEPCFWRISVFVTSSKSFPLKWINLSATELTVCFNLKI